MKCCVYGDTSHKAHMMKTPRARLSNVTPHVMRTVHDALLSPRVAVILHIMITYTLAPAARWMKDRKFYDTAHA